MAVCIPIYVGDLYFEKQRYLNAFSTRYKLHTYSLSMETYGLILKYILDLLKSYF